MGTGGPSSVYKKPEDLFNADELLAIKMIVLDILRSEILPAQEAVESIVIQTIKEKPSLVKNAVESYIGRELR